MWPEFQRAEEKAQKALSMQHLTADDIKSMSVEDYSKMRSLLMAGVKQQAEQEITESTCMWCGKGGWPDVDAHEAECEG